MLSAFRSDQLVEVFSFKLCAAWSDHLENYILGCTKYNLHTFPMYFNVIISYSFTTAIPPPSPDCRRNVDYKPVTRHILPHFHFSLRHIVVHALTLLAL